MNKNYISLHILKHSDSKVAFKEGMIRNYFKYNIKYHVIKFLSRNYAQFGNEIRKWEYSYVNLVPY